MTRLRRDINQSGQIGLVVLLIGAVLMTIGIGAVSQSIIETKTAKQETESSQTFSYAEQGVEQVLNDASMFGNVGVGGSFVEGSYHVTYTSDPQTSYQATILEGHSADINMTSAPSLSLTWTTNTGCGDGNAALIVTLIDTTGTQLRRFAYSRPACAAGLGFIMADSCTGSAPYTCKVNSVNWGVGFTPVKARVKVVFDAADLTATGMVAPQMHDITALATNSITGETRAVQASKTMPSVPGIFDYALFSGVGISQ